MGNIVFSQAAKFLKKRRNTRRWIAVVLCLALIVTSGTFGALTRHGSALTGAEQVLACTYENHVHGEECYNEAGELVCGYADYCVHVHNESCYDSEDNLICPLPEIEAHVHDESCYVDEEQLVCGMEENEIHQHTDDCYDIELGDIVCGMEEHVHDDSCYELITEGEEIPENGEAAQGRESAGSEEPTQSEEPAGSEAPVQNEEPAGNADAAQSEEPAGSEESTQSTEPAGNEESVQSTEPAESAVPQSETPSEDTDAAQSEAPAESVEASQSEAPAESTEPAGDGINECAENRRLICEKEEHTHGNECYNQNKVLKCGKEEGIHTHNEMCYEMKQVAKCGKLELHTHSEECYTDGVLTCGKLELTEHVHGEECFKKAPVMELSTVVDGVTVTVTAAEEDIIPEGAQVSVTPVVKTDAEALEDETAKAEAEALNEKYDEIQQGLEASMEEDETKELKHFQAYDINFYVENENNEKEEVQLGGDVTVKMEFDGSTLPEEITSDETVQIDSVDLVDIKKTEEGLKPETVQDAVVDTTQDDSVQKAEMTMSGEGSTIAFAWIGEINPETGEYLYEDEDVIITAVPLTEGALPENAKLQVVPILPEKDEEQYQQVMDKLAEKAEEEEFQIAGFLAYDISFLDEDNNKIEPEDSRVKVTIEYRNATIPEEVKYFGSQVMGLDGFENEEAPQDEVQPEMETSITVMHLEEDETGAVTQVVDMGATGDITSLEATENQEIQKAEFETESFSTFVITWTVNNFKKATITVHYVDENGVEIPGFQTDKVTGNMNGDPIDFTSGSYKATIVGYKFSKIAVDKVNGTPISKLKYTTVTTGEGNAQTTNYHIQYNLGSWDTSGNWVPASADEKWVDWKNIHSNATAGDIYIVYNKMPASPISEVSDAPGHNKYIRYNENYDNYTLTLDVAGKKGEAQGVDVLFVIDKSGSMNDRIVVDNQYTTLMGALKSTAESVIPTIVPEGTVNQVAAVSFSSKNTSGDIETEWEGHTNGTNPVVTQIKSLSPNGSTNWQLAMQRAENKLAEAASDNNQKVVIFMSDGEPGYYFSKNDSGGQKEYGQSSGYSPDAYTAAVNEVKRSTHLRRAKIYSVNLTNSTSTRMTNFASDLKEDGIDAIAVDGTNLNTSLTNLVNTIIAPVYEEVVIEDTLSEFVEFAELGEDGKPVFDVWYKQVDGTTNAVTWGRVDTTKYTVQYPIGSNDKKFTLTFNKTDEKGILDPNITYSISYKVKASEKAKEAYRNNDYDYPASMKGDDGTDAPARVNIPDFTDLMANTTSSGEGGFYSNELAVLKYKEKDGIQKVSEYPHPVIQVKMDRPVESNLEFDKTATVKDWDGRTYDINIVAASKVTSTTTTEGSGPADIMMVFDISGSMNFKTSDDSETSWSQSLGNFKTLLSTNKLDTTKLYYYGKSKHSGLNGSSATGGKQPMIYLGGKWKYYNGTTWQVVPDNSTTEIYMFPSRLTALKQAATTFVTSTAVASPDSKIGVVTFSSKEQGVFWTENVPYGETVRELAVIGSELNDLIEDINKIYAGGGTYINAGLSLTENPLKEEKKPGVSQYVILFCDGASDTSDDRDSAKATADRLKNAGVTVYTIGFGLTEANSNWLKENIASPDCALTADTTEELGNIFKIIQESITQSAEIKNAMIKDVIDPRFVILDDADAPIVAGNKAEGAKYDETDIANGIELSNGGKVYLDEQGNQFIVWNEQTIPNAKDGSWSRTITVKAKEDYIGGNNVPTNISPDSIISTGGYGTAVLPQPTVNVKPILEVENNEVTIFKGDVVPTDEDILNALLSDKVYKDVNASGSYEQIGVNQFDVKWYVDEGCTQEITKAQMEQERPESTTCYYMKVTYVDESATDESKTNTTKDGTIYTAGDGVLTAVNADTTNYPNKKYGVYTINVIPGEIQIVKKLDEVSTSDQIFRFSVDGVDSTGTNFNKEVQITVKANTLEGVLDSANLDELKGLKRGTYVITELETEGYAVQETAIVGTNCKNSQNDVSKTVSFALGFKNDEGDIDVISNTYEYNEADGGTLGIATFINEEVTNNWAIVKRSSTESEESSIYLSGANFTLTSDDGTTVYYGKSGSDETTLATNTDNGTVKWYKDANYSEPAELEAGTYTLKETKAPDGYVLSNVEWTVMISGNGALKSINAPENVIEVDEESGKTIIYFDNETVYALPSTGGEGIYWYSIGGTLLMMAGALILYRNKNKKVRGCRRA